VQSDEGFIVVQSDEGTRWCLRQINLKRRHTDDDLTDECHWRLRGYIKTFRKKWFGTKKHVFYPLKGLHKRLLFAKGVSLWQPIQAMDSCTGVMHIDQTPASSLVALFPLELYFGLEKRDSVLGNRRLTLSAHRTLALGRILLDPGQDAMLEMS
jgi:hypothetical protein